jgi:hypothetical protein
LFLRRSIVDHVLEATFRFQSGVYRIIIGWYTVTEFYIEKNHIEDASSRNEAEHLNKKVGIYYHKSFSLLFELQKQHAYMKKSISIVAIAAVFAVGSAFTTRFQVQQWNVDHPEQGSPGFYFLSVQQVKLIFCPGVSNVECAYLVNTMGTTIKKP